MGLGFRTLTFLAFFYFASLAYGGWQGPYEIVKGSWGSGERDFGIDEGDNLGRLPSLDAILADGKIIISDPVNEREVIYKEDGSLLKTVLWDVYEGGVRTPNPDYAKYQYVNLQGFTQEGNLWLKIDDYLLKSPDGNILSSTASRPLILGSIKEEKIGSKQYRIIVNFPERSVAIIGEARCEKYMRDVNAILYCVEESGIARYNDCGKEMGNLNMPERKTAVVSTTSEPGIEPLIRVLEDYGAPVLGPNGDVYTWKRTPAFFSIVKWSWRNDANAPSNTPDPPTDLKLRSSGTGLSLEWKTSIQDPGCVAGYEVGRSLTAGGGYTRIGTVEKAVFMYEDTTAEAGKTYYYKVRAMGGEGYSDYSNEVNGKLDSIP